MRTLPATLVRGWTDDVPVVVRDELVVLHDDVTDVVPAQVDRAIEPIGVTVLVARTSTGPARRRLPVALASRALTAVRGDRADDGAIWAAAAHAVPMTIAAALTGQRL